MIPDSPSDSSRRRHLSLPNLRDFFIRYLDIGLFLAIVCPLLGLLGNLWWGFDLFSHFRWQYVATLVLAAGLYAVFRKWKRAALAGIAAAAFTAPFISYFLPPPAAEKSAGELKVISFNVLTSNPRVTDVREFLRKENADLIFLMEVNAEWLAALDLKEQYPHSLQWPREDNFGVAVFSKTPLPASRVVEFPPWGLPTIQLHLPIADRSIEILGTHPLPPAGAEGYLDRNFQLEQVARLLSTSSSQSRILLGDLNLTPFSPVFASFLRASGLKDSARGFGLPATWMAGTPLAIPIDHCLISSDLRILERRTGPALGSDHRPLILRIGIP